MTSVCTPRSSSRPIKGDQDFDHRFSLLRKWVDWVLRPISWRMFQPIGSLNQGLKNSFFHWAPHYLLADVGHSRKCSRREMLLLLGRLFVTTMLCIFFQGDSDQKILVKSSTTQWLILFRCWKNISCPNLDSKDFFQFLKKMETYSKMWQ